MLGGREFDSRRLHIKESNMHVLMIIVGILLILGGLLVLGLFILGAWLDGQVDKK